MIGGPIDSTERGLDGLAEILSEALAATPWLARSSSRGASTCELQVLASEDGDQLELAAMHVAREEVVDSWSYSGLSRLRATPERMVAYASCVAKILAHASADDRPSEMIPAPSLLSITELVTADDFERERLNVELEERAVAQLRDAAGA